MYKHGRVCARVCVGKERRKGKGGVNIKFHKEQFDQFSSSKNI